MIELGEICPFFSFYSNNDMLIKILRMLMWLKKIYFEFECFPIFFFWKTLLLDAIFSIFIQLGPKL